MRVGTTAIDTRKGSKGRGVVGYFVATGLVICRQCHWCYTAHRHPLLACALGYSRDRLGGYDRPARLDTVVDSQDLVGRFICLSILSLNPCLPRA